MPKLDELHPSTVDGIKRLADRLQSDGDLKRAEALDRAARQAGFQNFAHARRGVEGNRYESGPPARPQQPAPSHRDIYRREQRRGWSEKINATVGPSASTSMTWQRIDQMAEILRPFMGSGQNHGYFPTGGGHDFLAVRRSTTEPDFLEFEVSSRLFYLGRPARLRLERIEQETAESFLYIELESIGSSGVYSADEDGLQRDRAKEELVDLGGGGYVERGAWDRGFVEDEDEPLPDTARLVHRILGGGLMIVCKASIWNGIPQTYRGVHNQLGPDGVRRLIETGLARRGTRADG
jgi:hypothetical protein